MFARLKSGVALAQAQADLNQIAANLERLCPADDKERGITAALLVDHVVANVRIALLTPLATVGMVLLVACADIANLMLHRAVTRRREIAVGIALGAAPCPPGSPASDQKLAARRSGRAVGFRLPILHSADTGASSTCGLAAHGRDHARLASLSLHLCAVHADWCGIRIDSLQSDSAGKCN